MVWNLESKQKVIYSIRSAWKFKKLEHPPNKNGTLKKLEPSNNHPTTTTITTTRGRYWNHINPLKTIQTKSNNNDNDNDNDHRLTASCTEFMAALRRSSSKAASLLSTHSTSWEPDELWPSWKFAGSWCVVCQQNKFWVEIYDLFGVVFVQIIRILDWMWSLKLEIYGKMNWNDVFRCAYVGQTLPNMQASPKIWHPAAVQPHSFQVLSWNIRNTGIP